jgi:hypothetical protein
VRKGRKETGDKGDGRQRRRETKETGDKGDGRQRRQVEWKMGEWKMVMEVAQCFFKRIGSIGRLNLDLTWTEPKAKPEPPNT